MFFFLSRNVGMSSVQLDFKIFKFEIETLNKLRILKDEIFKSMMILNLIEECFKR